MSKKFIVFVKPAPSPEINCSKLQSEIDKDIENQVKSQFSNLQENEIRKTVHNKFTKSTFSEESEKDSFLDGYNKNIDKNFGEEIKNLLNIDAFFIFFFEVLSGLLTSEKLKVVGLTLQSL